MAKVKTPLRAVLAREEWTHDRFGARQILERRCVDAGFRPCIRTSSGTPSRWLATGGQEHDLMRLAGRRSGELVGRYAVSAADDQAHDAHRHKAREDRV